MWISNPFDFNNFYIGLSFPEANFLEFIQLSAKRQNTEIAKQSKETLPPEQIFTAEDKVLLDKNNKIGLAIKEKNNAHRPFSNDPTQA